MNPDLLPCPFCGTTPVYKKQPKRAHVVICTAPYCPATPICVDKDLEQVGVKWNTRAPLPISTSQD